MIEPVGFDESTRREVLLASPDSLAAFDARGLPAGHCIVLVTAATHALDEATIHRFAAMLLDAGAVYVCCWGPGCERLHDLLDDAVLFRQSPVSESAVIMSTWHSDESLEDALFFALTAAWPSADYAVSCRKLLAL